MGRPERAEVVGKEGMNIKINMVTTGMRIRPVSGEETIIREMHRRIQDIL